MDWRVSLGPGVAVAPPVKAAASKDSNSAGQLGQDQVSLSAKSVKLAHWVDEHPLSNALEKAADTWSEGEATFRVLKAVAGTSTGVGHAVASGIETISRPGVVKSVEGVQKVVPIVNVLTALVDRARTHVITNDPKSSTSTKVWAGVTEGLSWGVVATNVAAMVVPSRYKAPLQLVGLGMDLTGIGTGIARDRLYAKDQAATP